MPDLWHQKRACHYLTEGTCVALLCCLQRSGAGRPYDGLSAGVPTVFLALPKSDLSVTVGVRHTIALQSQISRSRSGA